MEGEHLAGVNIYSAKKGRTTWRGDANDVLAPFFKKKN